MALGLATLRGHVMNAIGTALIVVVLGVPAEPAEPKIPVDPKNFVDYEKVLNERLSEGVTPQTNANVLIVRALGPKPEGGKGHPPEYFKRLGIDPLPDKGDYFIGFTDFSNERLKLSQDDLLMTLDQLSRVTKRPWSAKEFPHIAAWLKANEKPLALVIEGVKRPRYYDPVIAPRTDKGPGMLMSALLPNVQRSRELAAALTGRALLRTAEGKYDEAWQDLLACHRLARHVGGGGAMIHALVGYAVNAVACQADLAHLANAKLSTDQIRSRLKDLQNLPPIPAIADVLDVGERIMYLDSLQHIRLGTDAAPEEKKGLAMIDWEPAIKNGVMLYDRMTAAARLEPRAARESAFDRIEEILVAQAKEARKDQDNPLQFLFGNPGKTAGKRIGTVLAGLLAPALRKVHNAHDRATQTERNLHLAFALAAYRGDTGRYPAKLADLAPKYLDKVPGDLFGAKPLIYKPSEKGYLLYSVGIDGKDGGGRSYDDPSGDDLTVRMPLPALKEAKK